MKTVSFQSPRPPKTLNRFADELPLGSIDDDTTYSDLELTEREYSGCSARRVAIARASFERVNFSKTTFPEIDAADLNCNDCDFANAVWRKAILNRAQFNSCRLLGWQMNESHIRSTLLRECNASLAQFRFAHFQAVRFENCNLKGAAKF